MANPLFTKLASDSLLAWLQTNLPVQIAALGAQGPTAWGGPSESEQVAIAIDPIATWSDHPTVTQAATPACYVLPQLSGIRTPDQSASLDEQHRFLVCFEVGAMDQGVSHAQLMYYVAAMVRAVVAWYRGQAPMPAGCQVMLGFEGSEDVVAWDLVPETSGAAGFYEMAKVATTVFCSELP